MTSPVAVGHDTSNAIRHIEHVMGTVVTIDVYSDDDTWAPEVSMGIARARATLRHADALFSTWKPNSPMSRLRRGRSHASSHLQEVADVLELCAVARQLSGGWFDPWAMPGGVDPTGYVKGWAAQRALAELASPGLSGAMVNAAGDIASFGGPEPGTDFRVGIVDPFSPAHIGMRRRTHRGHRDIGQLRAWRSSDRPPHGTPHGVRRLSQCHRPGSRTR